VNFTVEASFAAELFCPPEEQAGFALVLCALGIDADEDAGVIRARAAMRSGKPDVMDEDRGFSCGESADSAHCFQCSHDRDKRIRKKRSSFRSLGRGRRRFMMASCWRRARFSAQRHGKSIISKRPQFWRATTTIILFLPARPRNPQWNPWVLE